LQFNWGENLAKMVELLCQWCKCWVEVPFLVMFFGAEKKILYKVYKGVFAFDEARFTSGLLKLHL